MFSNKTLLSVLAATGLSFGAAACGSDGAGSVNFLCEGTYECAYGTLSYDFVGAGEEALPEEYQDELDDLAAASACANSLEDGVGSVEEEAVEDCNPLLTDEEDPIDTCDVTVSDESDDELGSFEYTIEATVNLYEFSNYEDCAALEDDLGSAAE